MGPHALRAASLFTGERLLPDHAVVVADGVITGVVPAGAVPAGLPVEDLGPGLLAPGFIDAQVNGGGGVLFNETRTADGAAAIAAAHRRFGSTGLLPTFITDTPERRAEAVAAVRTAIAQRRPGVLGLHLEGPFLARARKGAHDPALIVPMTDADVDAILDSGIATLMLTVAAENAAPRLIRRLVAGGVIVSIGHSDAPYETVAAAVAAGARCVTHLFNAMSPLGHRDPGVVGAALDHGELWCGLIADGHHVDPAVLRLALRGKQGPGRLFLVTDAMPPAGAPGDRFTLTGRTVTRREGRLLLDDGTLAGSDLTMDRAVTYAVERLAVPLEEALRMASLYPAQALRLDATRGRIAAGFQADLVLLDAGHAVTRVWVGGQDHGSA